MREDQTKRRLRTLGDHNGPIKDGETMYVPLMLMDHEQSARRPLVVDMDGGTAGLHRPGYRLTRDASLTDEQRAAYREYADAISNAWRGSDDTR